MKKKIKDLTLEEVFKIKGNCLSTYDCEHCPLNYREDGIQSVLCELVNDAENTIFVEKFLNEEIEVNINEKKD